jgi:transposase InsO family protein
VAHGEVTTAPEVCAKVSGMSAATIDRLLAPARARMVGRSRARTKPGTLLRNQVPVRTHRELEGLCAGSVAVDCVGHDGGNGSGEFCQTVVMTDIVTGWTELRAVRNKAHVWVFAALKELCRRFPYPIRAIHSDNGGEFINHHLIAYCRAHGLRFTRSRAARKNDNCHVEQKNWSVARRAIGYGRYVGVAATAALNRVYDVLRLHVNFWQPSHHLRAKWREGSKLCKRYGRAITPCQLTLNLAEIPPAAKVALQACFAPQNPAALKRAITRRQAALRHYNQHTFIADASPELVAARLHSASASHPKRRFACA